MLLLWFENVFLIENFLKSHISGAETLLAERAQASTGATWLT